MTTSEGHRDSSRVAQGVNPLRWLKLTIDVAGREIKGSQQSKRPLSRRDQPATSDQFDARKDCGGSFE